MTLWLRLVATLIAARFRPPITLPGEASRLAFRVWPHDLDPSLHMNNARYLALLDLGRLDLMLASGLGRSVLRHRWTPIAGKIAIRFRRELALFQGFRLETRILTWDDTSVVMEQVFVIACGRRDGQIAAHAMFKGGLYDRGARAFVPTARLMGEIGVTDATPPAANPEVAAFLAADDAMRRGLGEGRGG